MPRRNSGARLKWIERRRTFYIVWYEHGRERLRSTGETEQRRAEAALATFIRATQRPTGGPRPAHEVEIGAVLDYYARNKGRFAADPARIAYAIDALLPYWAAKRVNEVNDATCAAYVEQRQRAAGTTRRELSTLRAALNYAAGRITDASPPVALPDGPAGKDRWLTRGEAARLLNAARGGRSDVRLYLPLFIVLGLYTGARKEAILSLRWPQVDLAAGRINFANATRTNKGRAHIPIPRPLMTFLRLARRRAAGDLGFVVHDGGKRILDIGGAWNGQADGFVQGSFGRACKRAGLVGVTPHTLRHSCGTWLAQAGVPLRDIGGWLGHTDARTSALYAHHHPDYQAGARRALERRK